MTIFTATRSVAYSQPRRAIVNDRRSPSRKELNCTFRWENRGSHTLSYHSKSTGLSGSAMMSPTFVEGVQAR